MEDEHKKPKAPPDEATPAATGLEAALEGEVGFLRDAPVEGGDELSIGGGPPSAAGGEPRSPVPTRDDIRDLE
ncbi:MAG: hypothetical protein IRZ16_20440 [Myxococcaceae bacterium]|nr:hypothetical protein [Myxococcaceae bacterium]